MRNELVEISDDGDALQFALGGFFGLLPRLLLEHFHALLVTMTGSEHTSAETTPTPSLFDGARQPRLLGVISVIAAVGLGFAYMRTAGAPVVYLGSNLGALAIGLAIMAVTVRISPVAGRWSGIEILAMASFVLATALFGRSVEGTARWFAVGPLFVQTSLIVLPVMIIAFARTQSAFGASGMCVAALALGLQPDRAMAGVLLVGLAALAFFCRGRFVGVALASALIAFVVTLMRPDTLPASPYVDQILFSAFDVHPLAGVAVWSGAALLLAPAIVGWRGASGARTPAVVFGAVWLAVILAAVLGNYPTPVVGNGASAIIGYLLCLSALPKSVALRSRTRSEPAGRLDRDPPTWNLRTQTLALVGVVVFGTSDATAQEALRDCNRTEVEKVEIPNGVRQPGPCGEQIPLWPALPLPDDECNSEMIGRGSPLIEGRTTVSTANS